MEIGLETDQCFPPRGQDVRHLPAQHCPNPSCLRLTGGPWAQAMGVLVVTISYGNSIRVNVDRKSVV